MLKTPRFIEFVNKVWPGNYNINKTQVALSKTLNITAYDGDKLVGCLRILSNGSFVEMRNRIIHRFLITDSDGSQLLVTKTKVEKGNKQFKITEEYLLEFIALNEELSSALYEFRGF